MHHSPVESNPSAIHSANVTHVGDVKKPSALDLFYSASLIPMLF